MKNEILLRRKGKVLLPKTSGSVRAELVKIASKNLESLGYKFSKRLSNELQNHSFDQLSDFYKETVKTLQKQLGDHVEFKPFYPGFPEQVKDSSQIELYINALFHYATGSIPAFDSEAKFPLQEKVELKEIDLAEDLEFDLVFDNLLKARGSWSVSDKEDIEKFVNVYQNQIFKRIPEQIPIKENAAFIVSAIHNKGIADFNFITKYLKTATDVLRFCVALSGGDVSLTENTKFRNIKRPERKVVLKLLEHIGQVDEDMMRFQGPWIRLGERLHPFEFSDKYPIAAKGFKTVRDNLEIRTFNSELEKSLENHNLDQILGLLKERPGEFSRKLDSLLRTFEGNQILEEFKEVVKKVSTPVLLQNLAHFKNRNSENPLRVFFPKGEVAKAYAVENKLPRISVQHLNQVIEIITNELVSRFSKLDTLGKVYIDPKMKNYTVPLSQRSASKSLRTVSRGSVFDLPKGNTIRFFLWWKEGVVNGQPTGRVDIDLSSVMYDKDWKYLTHISWTNLKDFNAYHSGDIVTAPDGACEFIDIDIESVLKFGGRYVVMSVNGYTPQPYCNLPECFAGWMMRKNPNSGEIFEAKTVQDKVDLTANTSIAIPIIIDLQAKKVIWTDIALSKNPQWYNTVEGNGKGMALMGRAMTSLIKPNLFDLFEMHAKARGELVTEQNSADVVFSENNGITPYDIETILANFVK